MSAHPVDVHVGKRLRLRRLTLGFSQEQVALHLSITFQQIQKNEKGLNRMGASRLFELARFLGCDTGYFFEGLEPPSPTPASLPPDEDRLCTRESLELMRSYYRIADATVRRKVFEMVKAVGRGTGEGA